MDIISGCGKGNVRGRFLRTCAGLPEPQHRVASRSRPRKTPLDAPVPRAPARVRDGPDKTRLTSRGRRRSGAPRTIDRSMSLTLLSVCSRRNAAAIASSGERAGSAEDQCRQRGDVEQVRLIARRTELRPGCRHAAKLDRAEPVRQVHRDDRDQENHTSAED